MSKTQVRISKNRNSGEHKLFQGAPAQKVVCRKKISSALRCVCVDRKRGASSPRLHPLPFRSHSNFFSHFFFSPFQEKKTVHFRLLPSKADDFSKADDSVIGGRPQEPGCVRSKVLVSGIIGRGEK